MAGPVYSTRFFSALQLETNDGYTVPDGYRAVLRDVDLTIYGSESGVQFEVGGNLGQIIWLVIAGAGTAESFTWRGRQVFEPGEIITFDATGHCDVTASGYLLTLP